MMRCITHSDLRRYVEYHGNTSVELTEKKDGRTVFHRWFFFDSPEEAEAYFHEAA